MKVVIGNGCIGDGFKERPDDLRAFIDKFLDTEDLENFVYYLVENYGECTYSDKTPCDACGDYYYEYTLEV